MERRHSCTSHLMLARGSSSRMMKRSLELSQWLTCLGRNPRESGMKSSCVKYSLMLFKSRDKITGTISDTLRRNNKKKKSKAANNIPTFLFVNKPYFSSEESIADPCYAVDPMPSTSRYNINQSEVSNLYLMSYESRGATQSPEISRYQGSHYQESGKRYRSEMMLNIPNRWGYNSVL